MSSPIYGLSPDQVTAVVNGTEQAISDMQSLNNQVQSTGGDLGAANVSDSGVKTQNAISEWNDFYSKIINDINGLNQDVQSVNSVGQSAAANANGVA
jgi:hypothetical protein